MTLNLIRYIIIIVKRSIKKTISFIVVVSCVISLLSSCNNDSDKEARNSFSKNDSRIEIYFPEAPLSIPGDGRIEKWEDYMRGKYGFDLNLNYLYKSSVSYVDFDDLLDVSNGDGLILVDSYSALMELISSDMIIPMNFYQDRLNNYKNINPEMIDSLTDSYGNLWAVPLTKGDPWINKRTYNKEWLDEIGVPVPETVDEFFDLAMYVAHGDPDGNGINDTYIAEYNNRLLFSQFSDVFKAFGCYPSGSFPIAYNPLDMRIENFITEGNFTEAMEFIKALEDQGLIINSDTALHNYQVASTMGYWSQEYETERTYGFYLRGPNEKRLIEIDYPEGCIAVLKNTDKPTDMLDSLYELIYSSTDSYMDFMVGIKGEDYFDMIDHYSVNFSSDDPQEFDKFRIGIPIDLNRADLDVKPLVQANNPSSTIATQKYMDIAAEFWEAGEAVEKYLGTDLSYRVSFDVYDDEVLSRNANSGYESKMINDILTNDIPIEEAVEEYKLRIGN